MPPAQTSIRFGCLGNICRSPLAHGIFQHLVNHSNQQHLYHIDSCGTGSWHVGNPPDPRSIQTAALYNIDITSQRARQLDTLTDIERFDHIIPMDKANHRDLVAVGVPESKLKLMRSFDPALNKPLDVPDPYYGGDNGFEQVYQMLIRACQGLHDHCQI